MRRSEAKQCSNRLITASGSLNLRRIEANHAAIRSRRILMELRESRESACHSAGDAAALFEQDFKTKLGFSKESEQV